MVEPAAAGVSPMAAATWLEPPLAEQQEAPLEQAIPGSRASSESGL